MNVFGKAKAVSIRLCMPGSTAERLAGCLRRALLRALLVCGAAVLWLLSGSRGSQELHLISSLTRPLWGTKTSEPLISIYNYGWHGEGSCANHGWMLRLKEDTTIVWADLRGSVFLPPKSRDQPSPGVRSAGAPAGRVQWKK